MSGSQKVIPPWSNSLRSNQPRLESQYRHFYNIQYNYDQIICKPFWSLADVPWSEFKIRQWNGLWHADNFYWISAYILVQK